MSALSTRSRWGLRSVALIYLSALLIIPVIAIFWRTFEHGISEPIDAVTSPPPTQASPAQLTELTHNH